LRVNFDEAVEAELVVKRDLSAIFAHRDRNAQPAMS
jgi:hypothetical protein